MNDTESDKPRETTNLALIGFMGAGKTTVARSLVTLLWHKRLVELDDWIAGQAGQTIAEIFAHGGEPLFRELEMQAVEVIAARHDQIISCGGGIVLRQNNMDRLRTTSRIVWLTAQPATIWQRLQRGLTARPLLQGPCPQATITQLLQLRQPLYRQAADWTIATDGLSPTEVAAKIVAWYRKSQNCSTSL